MRRWPAAFAVLALGLARPALAQGAAGFDGQYMGELALTAVINGDCTPPPLGAAYPLTVAGGVVRFVYAPRFATTLVGKVDARGNFIAAAHTRSGTVRMTGHLAGNTVTASIASPSCTYTYRTR